MTSRAHWPVVAIVGVGMIGGSIGKAVRARRLAGRVLGIGRSAESLAAAKKTGCVTDTATDLAAAADAEGQRAWANQFAPQRFRSRLLALVERFWQSHRARQEQDRTALAFPLA
jgi:hypothetical protein